MSIVAVIQACLLAARPDIGAIYFGDWHVNVQHEELHGANWTEWQLPIHATPRYPGHLQPNLPLAAPGFGLNQSEDDPQVMAHKIDAATANGIDFFLFDWYWYASPVTPFIKTDLQGAGGGPFLDGALNLGFLQAPNRQKMKFALMWANQDWVDIHPAKRGWHGTYRARPKAASARCSTSFCSFAADPVTIDQQSRGGVRVGVGEFTERTS